MAASGLDAAGQKARTCIRDVKSLSELVRKDMTLANEKERSVGFLCEKLAEDCEKLAQERLPSVQAALLGLATVLARVELHRKGLYQRMIPLAANCVLTPAKGAQPALTALERRDQAVRKTQRLPPAERDPRAAQSNLLRTQAKTMNSEAVREMQAWYDMYSSDLKQSLREYAHAQMEFAARALEQWSGFLADFTLLDFSEDIDEVVTKLETGAA
jgi:hypothetical protein